LQNFRIAEREVPTDGFSKKLENHAAMVSLYFRNYNFGRVHRHGRSRRRCKRVSNHERGGANDH
jgi:hypothetical protein